MNSGKLQSNNINSDAIKNNSNFQKAILLLNEIYGESTIGRSNNFSEFINSLIEIIQSSKESRNANLLELDLNRDDYWYKTAGRSAYTMYIDKFKGNLQSSIESLDYLKSIGVGLIHPLPLLKPREGNSDGGFAVADFTSTDPKLGSINDLEELCAQSHNNDIGVIIDIVCNHTAQEHIWAQKWLAHDPEYKDFYIALDTEDEVKEYELALQDVFPDTAPGSFTYCDDIQKYVWTTFYPFQWDLNYKNPKVFLKMFEAMAFLVNIGIDGFRLDSAPFLWKTKGTISRNHENTHKIVTAWRELLKLIAPKTIFLAEAIESINDVLPFFGTEENQECNLAYNNVVMTALWAALADENVTILEKAILQSFNKPKHGDWLNYIRCHDDIIWLALKDLAPSFKLQEWSDFYSGNNYPNGLAFQAPEGMPKSTCGMAAELCGVYNDDLGLNRLKLLYSFIYALDGIPLIYMGDEIGLKNDTSFLNDKENKDELRWLHRPKMDWEVANNPPKTNAEIFDFFKSLNSIFAKTSEKGKLLLSLCNKQYQNKILRLEQIYENQEILCFANFSRDMVNIANEIINEKYEIIYGDLNLGEYGVTIMRRFK